MAEDINWRCLLTDGGSIKKYTDYSKEKKSYIKIYNKNGYLYFLFKSSLGFHIDISISFNYAGPKLLKLIEWYENINKKNN